MKSVAQVWRIPRLRTPDQFVPAPGKEVGRMIILGLILLVIGLVVGIPVLYYIGGILLLIGIVLLVLGSVGRPVGGRKVWF
ncbi:MAG: hypothetical protein EKK42_06565 [Pseudonocardiaceae bacterium]|nr:MAG: hypothetical protein EKK42_06565 [Pseudonocardiaceae bacterium]